MFSEPHMEVGLFFCLIFFLVELKLTNMKIDINKNLPTIVSLAIIITFVTFAVFLNWLLWKWAYSNQPTVVETSVNSVQNNAQPKK